MSQETKRHYYTDPMHDNRPAATQNIAPRPGFYKHHDASCWMQLRYTTPHSRGFWCQSHGQWAYEQPVRIIYVYQDGEQLERIPPPLV